MSKQELVKRARMENQCAVRMRKAGFLAMAEQCTHMARGYLREARGLYN
jgi:hypothetical protein